MQGWKEIHPQHFLNSLRAVIAHLDSVSVGPLFHFRYMNPASLPQVVAPVRCPDIGEITVTMAGQIGVFLQHLGKYGCSGTGQTRDVNRTVNHPLPGFLSNNHGFEITQAFPNFACCCKKPGLIIQSPRNTDGTHGDFFQVSLA